MKNKKTRKRAMLSSVAMLLVSVVALTTATYAWFSNSSKAQVNSLDVNVASASGIQISLTGTDNWKSAISGSEILSASSFAGTLTPVSTALGPDAKTGEDNELKFYLGTMADGGNDVITTAATKNSQYLAVDLYVKVTQDCDVYLGSGSSVSDTTTMIKGSEALRIALVNCGYFENENAVNSPDINASDVPALSDAVYLWEPNSSEHVNAGSDLFYKTEIAANGNADAKYTYLGIDKEGTITDGKITSDDLLTNGMAKEITTAKTPLAKGTSNEDCKITSIKSGITKLRLYVWMEGQDADCVNDIASAAISANICFEKPQA